MARSGDGSGRRREAPVIQPLSAVEQQVIRLAHAMKAQRDHASQQAFQTDIQSVLAAHDCTGLTVSIVDHEGGLALEVSE